MPKKHKTDDSEQPKIPPFHGAISFPSWEKELFYAAKNHLVCEGCGQSCYANKGVSGEICQGGFRLISIKCSNEKCEEGSKRLLKVLESSDLGNIAQIYRTAYESTVSDTLSKTRTSRKRTASNKNDDEVVMVERPTTSIKHVGEASSVNTAEEETVKSIIKRLDEQALEIARAAEERKELKKVYEELSALRKENEELRKELNRLRTAHQENQKSINDDVFDNKKDSYARAASRAPAPAPRPLPEKKQISKTRTLQMFMPVPPPTEFTKIHVNIKDRRPLLKCESGKEKNELMNGSRPSLS
jgi:regulator of replication initiation timing